MRHRAFWGFMVSACRARRLGSRMDYGLSTNHGRDERSRGLFDLLANRLERRRRLGFLVTLAPFTTNPAGNANTLETQSTVRLRRASAADLLRLLARTNG